MEDIRKIIFEEVLVKGHLMSLGTQDSSGVWVSYVVYSYDENLNIYWLSKEDTRHSKALLSNPKVSGAISVNHRPKEPNIAIQFSGEAKKLDSQDQPIGVKRILKPGEAWYSVRPQFIDLIYEPLFGFTKQKYDLSNLGKYPTL